MNDLFSPPPSIRLPITGSNQYIPVRRIYCVGQNYAKHAKEMGSQVSQDAPFFFIKHPLDIIASGSHIDYPPGTNDLHFEIELVAVIGKTIFQADFDNARQSVCGLAVGIDLTRRDLQQQLRNRSHPWALSKSFTNAAVISSVKTTFDWARLYQERIQLKQNNVVRQEAFLNEMARTIEALIIYLSSLDTLHPGDLIFTGTPAGVGAIEGGDYLYGSISHIGEVELSVK